MEFGEWLFVNEYPVTDALDQVGAPIEVDCVFASANLICSHSLIV